MCKMLHNVGVKSETGALTMVSPRRVVGRVSRSIRGIAELRVTKSSAHLASRGFPNRLCTRRWEILNHVSALLETQR